MDRPIQLKIVKPGLQTLVIDSTRLGMQKYGVPIGGPMDLNSAKLANWLVGNRDNELLLEITMQGPVIESSQNCQVAITGAHISLLVNGNPVDQNQTIEIKKGDILTIGKVLEGSRAYLAIRGKWRPLNNGDNFQNRVLKKGDELLINSSSKPILQRKAPVGSTQKKECVIKAIPGPEWDSLPEGVRETLVSTTFTVLPESNRMGYRLSPGLPEIGVSIISSGVVPGVLQITPHGLPILLMQDAPTTGGYARALVVLSEDLPKLGQLKPGDKFLFSLQ